MSDLSPRVAVALPAKNEAGDLPACLDALDCAAARFAGKVSVVIVANNCTDATARVLEETRMRNAALLPISVSLLPAFRHAGWARRLAFDAAAATLTVPDDVLMSTDADTRVSPEWIVRAVGHLSGGIDAVAGRALTRRDDRRSLGVEAMRRLNLLGRYYTALDWLRADAAPLPHDPWPRHFYEGGASIALTLGTYRRIGGAPTPTIAEDRALFAAVRDAGGMVRHPLDVRVFTSSRLDGRAPGGMADAFARWIAQPIDEPLHETYAFPAALDPARATAHDRLTFETLPDAVRCAGAMVRARRSAAAEQVETVALAPLRTDHLDRIAQQRPEPLDSVVT
ncbi:Glycosyltransferase like family 2 [Sphingomonas palmae]|uniref:Glycosyltransferase like family 2 n=1 Tax=Sphingomonas palmae TaxID=1855283 RepID=A0A1H7H5G2_9SPHN|nr:glycosyltransferase [Sphingomonas palmae]SEK44987.1 Glycosyltransferase like family 2 [Sphingomonas palmae]